jgi:hypothetical protein
MNLMVENELFMFIFSAFVTAIFYLIPIFLPLFSPSKLTLAGNTYFGG